MEGSATVLLPAPHLSLLWWSEGRVSRVCVALPRFPRKGNEPSKRDVARSVRTDGRGQPGNPPPGNLCSTRPHPPGWPGRSSREPGVKRHRLIRITPRETTPEIPFASDPMAHIIESSQSSSTPTFAPAARPKMPAVSAPTPLSSPERKPSGGVGQSARLATRAGGSAVRDDTALVAPLGSDSGVMSVQGDAAPRHR